MKILFIRISSLGDIVLTEPVIRIIREEYNSAELHYLCREAFAPIVEAFDNIDHIHFWKDKKNLIKILRKQKFDLIIDLHDKLNTWIIKTLLKPTKSITYKKQHFRRLLLVKKLSSREIDSTLDFYKTILPKLNISSKHYYPKLVDTSNNDSFISDLLLNYGVIQNKTLIGIFPGATHFTKMYPVKLWIKFIKSVPETWNCQFLLLGSHKEKLICTEIKRKTGNRTVEMSATTNTGQLISLVNRLDGVVSNDSGPMHIAAALNKPQIAIFGATHTKLGFRPLNDKAVVIQKNVKCQPCSLHGGKECPKDHFVCMNSIKPGEILGKFKLLLENQIWDV